MQMQRGSEEKKTVTLETVLKFSEDCGLLF